MFYWALGLNVLQCCTLNGKAAIIKPQAQSLEAFHGLPSPTQHKCYIVATCDRDLKRRIRKVPGVPIMYITQHRYSIERMPDAYGGVYHHIPPTYTHTVGQT